MLCLLAVSLAAVLPYLSTLHGYYLADDFGLVQLFHDKPTLHFATLFTRSWTENIWGFTLDELRPFPALSYQIAASWGAESPVANHVINLIVHLLCSVLVFGTARCLAERSLAASTFAGLLFAIMPVHVEPVSWITGRADSFMGLFYVASLFCYGIWRLRAIRTLYLASVCFFFVALFSKQHAVTLPVMLIFYDIFVARRGLRFTAKQIRPYIPFLALTLIYLGMRFVLFQSALREDQVTTELPFRFLQTQALYAKLMLIGEGAIRLSASLLLQLATWVGLGLMLVFLACALGSTHRSLSGGRGGTLSLVLYYGVTWWVVSTGPLVVAGYESQRLLYTAAVGFVITLSFGFDHLWSRTTAFAGAAAVLGATTLSVAMLVRLHPAVAAWNRSAAMSERMKVDMEAQTLAAPPGALLLVGAKDHRMDSRHFTWEWAWAFPFVIKPPFTGEDISTRATIVSRRSTYYYGARWFVDAQRALRAWSSTREDAPIIAIWWDGAVGSLMRRTDAHDLELRKQVQQLQAAETEQEMEAALASIFVNIP